MDAGLAVRGATAAFEDLGENACVGQPLIEQWSDLARDFLGYIACLSAIQKPDLDCVPAESASAISDQIGPLAWHRVVPNCSRTTLVTTSRDQLSQVRDGSMCVVRCRCRVQRQLGPAYLQQ